MSVIPIDDESDAVISELARKLHVSKDEVIRMLIDGEIKVGGMDMDPEMEEKLAKILGKSNSGSIIDKMMEMKMLEKLDSGDKKADMSELMEIMKVKMMMEAMQTKKNESIDPNMILMLYLMKGDSGKADMTKIIETVTQSTQTKDDAMKDLLKQLLEEKQESEKEQQLMAVIEQQQQAIEELKKQLEETRRMMYMESRGDRKRKSEDEIFGAVDKIEKMKGTFERLGLTKPPNPEDREIAIKQDVVKAKADLDKMTVEKTGEIVDKVLDGVDRKMDKILTIVETLMKQPAQQREQTLEEFEARGQITPQEKQEIYQKMQEEVMKEQMNYTTPEPMQPVTDIQPVERKLTPEEKAQKAREMWEQGFDATQIARTLRMPINEVYKYRPEQKLK